VERLSQIRRLSARDASLPEGAAPAGTRGRILAVALRLFAERGFAGTSIRDIASAAGVQSATIYAHYRAKEQMLADLVRIGHEEHSRRLRAALLDSQPDPRKQLAALVRAHVRMHAEYQMLATVANSELHALSSELARPSLAIRDASTGLFLEVANRGVEQHVFDPPHVWLAIAAIGGMGIRVANWFTPGFELDAQRIGDIYAEFALSIMRAVDTSDDIHSTGE
jgi:AcrR family transcriptional regulator